jgi:hypothetical protein
MYNFTRKLGFSRSAISLGYWLPKESAREIKGTEVLLRTKMFERKARRRFVQRLFRQ